MSPRNWLLIPDIVDKVLRNLVNFPSKSALHSILSLVAVNARKILPRVFVFSGTLRAVSLWKTFFIMQPFMSVKSCVISFKTSEAIGACQRDLALRTLASGADLHWICLQHDSFRRTRNHSCFFKYSFRSSPTPDVGNHADDALLHFRFSLFKCGTETLCLRSDCLTQIALGPALLLHSINDL